MVAGIYLVEVDCSTLYAMFQLDSLIITKSFNDNKFIHDEAQITSVYNSIFQTIFGIECT
jgi:hypothetical protein